MENFIFLCSEYSYISEHFQKRWGYEVISIKKVWWIPILVETYNVPKAKLVDGRSVSGYW